MLSLRALLISALTGSAYATTINAPVYAFGLSAEPTPGDKVPSISADNARLYLAQHLGLSQYHSLKGTDETTLDLLNRQGAFQSALFTEHSEDSTTRTIIIIEGVDNPKEIIEGMLPVFTIADPPPPQSNVGFVNDLLSQYRQKYGRQNRRYKDVDDQIESLGMNGAPAAIHISGAHAIKDLHSTLSNLRELERTKAVIILMPSSKQFGKRNANDWGSYNKIASVHAARHAQQETPLSEEVPSPAKSKPSQRPSIGPSAKNVTNIPRVTMPPCYISEAICKNATAGCSGHGECYKKFTEHLSEDEEGQECWACKCHPLAVNDNKHIYWGGPACQKKDVSMPFFLLAGFTIAMVAAVTWGIGLLYSIGEEDLPSVLSAGISGPTARK